LKEKKKNSNNSIPKWVVFAIWCPIFHICTS